MKKFDARELKKHIRTIENWPVDGVSYRDITPLLLSPASMKMVIRELSGLFDNNSISHVGAIEARGFIFGAQVAAFLNLPLVPFRKAGKLPHHCLREEYKLEYGTATIEVHQDSLTEKDSVLLVDDLIATGGTLLAAVSLCKRLRAKVAGAVAVVDLPGLDGSKKLEGAGVITKSLVSY